MTGERFVPKAAVVLWAKEPLDFKMPVRSKAPRTTRAIIGVLAVRIRETEELKFLVIQLVLINPATLIF